jgi:uncharacterized repeat protein (TIGR01451 family)
MFRKLVSSLPFQPTLIEDIYLFIKQTNKELRLRKIGLLLLLIGFILNFVVLLISNNNTYSYKSDLVYGANSQKDILESYRRDTDKLGRADIRQIYNHYGISEAQISNAKVVNITSSDSSYTLVSRSPSLYNSSFVKIADVEDGGLYEQPFTSWNPSPFASEYKALTGLTSFGFRYWILAEYGGYIVIDNTSRKPNLEVFTSLNLGSDSQYNDSLSYTVFYRNNGNKWADDLSIQETLPKGVDFVSYYSSQDLSFNQNSNILAWSIPNKAGQLASGSNWHSITINIKINSQDIDTFCTNSKIKSGVSNYKTASQSCISLNPNKCPKPDNNGTFSKCNLEQINNSSNFLFNQNDVVNSTDLTNQTNNIVKSISVSNISKGIFDANNTTISTGDILEYNLSVKNIGTDIINAFNMSNENSFDINDILDYSSLVEIYDGNLNNNKITWDPISVKPGEVITKKLIFKINDDLRLKTLPYNKLAYNYSLDSYFGNYIELNIKDTSAQKLVKQINIFPNIKVNYVLVIILCIITTAVYLLYRAYLLKKEMQIIKETYDN